MDGVLGLPAQLQDLLGILREDLPGSRQRNTAAKALEQGGVEFLLQLAHLGADGRLRPEAGLGGFGKTLQPHDLKEGVELVEIHSVGGLRLPETKYESAR